MKWIRATFETLILSFILTVGAQAQSLMIQTPTGFRPMTPVELDTLGDPFFELVLKRHAETHAIAEVRTLIQPDASKHQVFVVSERAQNIRPEGRRRAVIAFRGQHEATGIEVENNVMLSVSMDPNQFIEGFVEAWGWDEQRGLYNYYRLDDDGGARSWKFHTSSANADTLSFAQRADTCLQCHVNGAPIMKELLRPWNNWDSVDDALTYLQAGTPNAWPVASNPQLSNAFQGAQVLEGMMIDAINRFNRKRLQALVKPVPNGDQRRVTEGKRLLRALFVNTEVNLISSTQKSGLHALPQVQTQGPQGNIDIPNSFFLNANLIAGDSIARITGLEVSEAKSFSSIALVKPDEYRKLVSERELQGGALAGDTNFAWFAVEPSEIDNNMVDLLIKSQVTTKAFVAAALSVDLKTPVFSEKRASLLRFIPDEFDISANPTHPDELTTNVMTAIEAASPAADSPEAAFLAALRLPDPVEALKTQVAQYRATLAQDLSETNAAKRQATLRDLFDDLLRRRQQMASHVDFRHLFEDRALLPLPTQPRPMP